MANCGRGDWLLCQITSNAYSDFRAIQIMDADFRSGSLRIASYARPGKLFTAHESLISGEAGILHNTVLKSIADSIVKLVQQGI
jgi:mRNA interferase MazF